MPEGNASVFDLQTYGPIYALLIGLAWGTWWLIRDIMKKNDEREQRYINVISEQAKAVQAVESLKHEVTEIKTWIQGGRDFRA